MICQHCNKEFPTTMEIDGIKRNLQNRKFCIECSPYKGHNTKPSLIPISITSKQCASCKIVKPLDEFYNRPDRENSIYSYCKICANIATIKRLQQNKINAINYKGGKCSICGYCKCQDSLDFHHLDPSKKEFSISNHKGMKLENIKNELDKCILVCSNCHGEIHAGQITLEHCITH